ncbi:MAG: hypothetical protein OEY78_08045 [Gammaproteobacteria bacterium]|nr:hypothetical protein [Gammaproteobacteria bacterium]
MFFKNSKSLKLMSLVLLLLLLTSCAAGHSQFTTESPAGFWYGLWHGVISFITLIIHLFNESVVVYEVNNSGGWYDFGFILGVSTIWGGGTHIKCKSDAEKKRDQEWQEIGQKVEIKVMRKLKDWAENDNNTEANDDWDEISDKVEKKLKHKIREWAEKD